MHSRARASGESAARFDRPARQATEPRAKREAMSALCHGLVVDLTFERSDNHRRRNHGGSLVVFSHHYPMIMHIMQISM